MSDSGALGWLRSVFVLVVAVTVPTFSLVACSANEPEPSDPAPKPASPTISAGPSPTKSDPPPPPTQPSTLKVPTNLVGQTLGKAKRRLAKLSFTNVVIAGGDVTNADLVVSVPRSGEKLRPNAKLVVVGHGTQPSGNPSSLAETEAPETSRAPPRAGYQCRPGDENRYPVCAGHKKWVDDQYAWGCQQGYIKGKVCSRFQ